MNVVNISAELRDRYLAEVAMEVGPWNEIRPKTRRWFRYAAPVEADSILKLSRNLVARFQLSRWCLIQIDNSTSFSGSEGLLFSQTLFGFNFPADIGLVRTILIDLNEGECADGMANTLLSHAIFLLLLFKAHAQIVSDRSSCGEMISIQDGFAYASRPDFEGKEEIEIVNKELEAEIPEWIFKLDAASQGDED